LASVAGNYPIPFKPIPCIAEEGAITVSDSYIGPGGALTDAYTFATAISVGDVVSLHLDTGNTYALTRGMAVVTAVAANTEPIFGIVTAIEPHVKNANGLIANQSTWATMLANGYYRICSVVPLGVSAILEVNADGGSTAITVGAPLIWDLSEDAFVDNGTTFTGVFSLNYCAADDTSVLAAFVSPTGFATGDDDMCGYPVQA